jgi:CRP-like cAMP-binding protein
LPISDTSKWAHLALRFKALGAAADDFEVLLQAMTGYTSVVAGDDIVRPGDLTAHWTVLLTGMACCYEKSRYGGRRILSFAHPGDFCDLYGYVVPLRRNAAGVQALSDVEVAVIDGDMDRLLERPALALAFWRATMLEVAIHRERVRIASRASELERVAHLLCEQLARREAVGINDAWLPISRFDVADAAGLSVDRTVQALRRLNVVSEGRGLEEIDKAELARVAKFDEGFLNMPRRLSRWAVRIDPA